MKTALILAGHGSHISPNTAGLVWKHVDHLRQSGIADEITAAFWKEMPSFHAVLNTLMADDVTIIPLFTAQGFFTQSVIPSEMGLEGQITRIGDRVIRYARTLSEHPYIGEIVRQRVEQALANTRYSQQQTAVTVIGHGTRRNSESRTATEAQVTELEESGLVAEVVATYLDDEPSIPQVYQLTTSPNIIAVPFFLAKGSHTMMDVPEALGLAEGTNEGHLYGRNVYYTDPVGTDETLLEAIIELAKEAGAPLYAASEFTDWDCFPQVGRDLLWQTVTDQGEFQFGELSLTADRVTVFGDDAPVNIISDMATLREIVRENPFRPLATATNLPRGWQVNIRSAPMLHAVVETIYPGAVADWFFWQQGQLDIVPIDQLIARQVGDYRQLAEFDQVDDVVNVVCGQCVRQPTWFDKQAANVNVIPCAEACNYWLTQAKGWRA